jgi:hypothetical protein
MAGFKCRDCEDIICCTCEELEQYVEQEDNVEHLKNLRFKIMKPQVTYETFEEKVSDIIVKCVSNLKFFIFCILLCFTPVVWKFTFSNIWKSSQEDVLFFSNVIQLLLLPIILIAGERQSSLDRMRDERKFRMLLVDERIDELLLSKN